MQIKITIYQHRSLSAYEDLGMVQVAEAFDLLQFQRVQVRGDGRGKLWVCSVKQGLQPRMGAVALPSTMHCVLLQWGQASDMAGIRAACCCCPSLCVISQHSCHCCSHTGEITQMCVFYFQGALLALWLSALLSEVGVLLLGH